MSEAERERIKLAAALLNTLAANTAVVGVLGPLAGMLYGVAVPDANDRLIAVLAIAVVVSAALHQTGRYVLGGLDCDQA